jgi:hypothetical protein
MYHLKQQEKARRKYVHHHQESIRIARYNKAWRSIKNYIYAVQLRGRFEIYKLGVKIRLRFFLWQIKAEMRKSFQ